MMFDDGTTARLAAEHFLSRPPRPTPPRCWSTWSFSGRPTVRTCELNITDVGDQWAQFAIAGPRAREVLAAARAGCGSVERRLPVHGRDAASRSAGLPGGCFASLSPGELAYELAVPARHALGAWSTLLQAGEHFGIRPYGLDALNTLRIEKGHVTGAELNGNTSAADLGFERLLKKQGDFVGRTLVRNVRGLRATDRLQLIGVRPVDRTQRLRNGAQLLSDEQRGVSLGYITSSTPSVELHGWVGPRAARRRTPAYRPAPHGRIASACREHRDRNREPSHA